MVTGVVDPDPRVSGCGLQYLREHGVDVKVADGIVGAQCSLLNAPFIFRVLYKRAHATLLTGITSVDVPLEETSNMMNQKYNMLSSSINDKKVEYNLLNPLTRKIDAVDGFLESDNYSDINGDDVSLESSIQDDEPSILSFLLRTIARDVNVLVFSVKQFLKLPLSILKSLSNLVPHISVAIDFSHNSERHITNETYNSLIIQVNPL